MRVVRASCTPLALVVAGAVFREGRGESCWLGMVRACGHSVAVSARDRE